MRQPIYSSEHLRIWERHGKSPLVEERQPHPVGGPTYAQWRESTLVVPAWDLIAKFFPELKINEPEFLSAYDPPYVWRVYSGVRSRCATLFVAERTPTVQEHWYFENVLDSGVPIRTTTAPAPAELLAHIAKGRGPLVHDTSYASLWRVLGEFPGQAPELTDV